MKFVLFITAALVASGTLLFKTLPLTTVPVVQSVEVTEKVTVKSSSVSGNITENKLLPASPLVTLNKTILKVALNKDRVIYLNEAVSFESSQNIANSIKRLQASSKEPIWLLIDSPGGSVLDGTTVISEMEASKAPVFTVCTRLCASMAAMIHSYGAKRYNLDRAILMYHPMSAGTQGQVPNMLSQLNSMARFGDKIVANVVNRSKVTKEQYEKLIAYEFWIDSEDALDKGLIDGIVNLNLPSRPEQLSVLVLPLPPEETQPSKRTKFNVEMISPNLSLWERK